MADPKCPDCGVKGIDKIVSTESSAESKGGDAWFEVVHCNDCGHVYGVIAKHVLSHNISPPIPRLT